MAVYEIKQKGNSPIWEFKCPLCGQQWSDKIVRKAGDENEREGNDQS